VLGVCERLAERLPVVLMVYANVVMTAGPKAFALRAADAGAAGLIVPDLPHDEAGEVRAACDAEGLALVPLVAPTTPAERVAAIGADARGFVYAVSLTGTTGERGELPPGLEETVNRVRGAAHVPVAVGFGISTPAQAGAVAAIADGVIVGSRLVRAAKEGGAQAVGDAVAELAGGLR
jgi:tryptophan synthase alpha chain